LSIRQKNPGKSGTVEKIESPMSNSLSLKRSFRVHSFLCNNKGVLRLSSIARFLQESAWEHAELWHAGYHSLIDEGLLWILYGLRVEIDAFPHWNDKIEVETWGKKYENLFAYRDFRINGEDNSRPLIKATSSWLLVDSKTHRPKRITPNYQRVPEIDDYALQGKPGNFECPDRYDSSEERKILYSDIDIYDHVNNTSYIQFCMDTSPDLQSLSEKVKSLDIRFVQESKLGESLILQNNFTENHFYFQGSKKETEKEVFRAIIGI
jgi:acyl-ACP thioesterase